MLDEKKMKTRFYLRLKTSGETAEVDKNKFDVIRLGGDKYKDELAVVTESMDAYELDKLISAELGGFDVLAKIRLIED